MDRPASPTPGVMSLVARLSAESRAQKEQLADLTSAFGTLATTTSRLSTENARLSSEVTELRSIVAEQGILIGELEKTSPPQGRFVFSAAQHGSRDAGSGVWWWSLARYPGSQEPPKSRQVGILATMTDLPVEVVEEIVGLLPLEDKSRLCRTSSFLREIASRSLYSGEISLDLYQAKSFVKSRRHQNQYGQDFSVGLRPHLIPKHDRKIHPDCLHLPSTFWFSPWIKELLHLGTVALVPSPRTASEFIGLGSGFGDQMIKAGRNDRPHHWTSFPSILVDELTLTVDSKFTRWGLDPWLSVLEHFNPVNFKFTSLIDGQIRPRILSGQTAVVRVPRIICPHWDRLESVTNVGGASTPVQSLAPDPHAPADQEPSSVWRLLFAPGRTSFKGPAHRRHPQAPDPVRLRLTLQNADGSQHPEDRVGSEEDLAKWLSGVWARLHVVALKWTPEDR